MPKQHFGSIWGNSADRKHTLRYAKTWLYILSHQKDKTQKVPHVTRLEILKCLTFQRFGSPEDISLYQIYIYKLSPHIYITDMTTKLIAIEKMIINWMQTKIIRLLCNLFMAMNPNKNSIWALLVFIEQGWWMQGALSRKSQLHSFWFCATWRPILSS